LLHVVSSAGMGYENAKAETTAVAKVALDVMTGLEDTEDMREFRERMGKDECVYHLMLVAGTGLGEGGEVGERVGKLLSLYSKQLDPRKIVNACHLHKTPSASPSTSKSPEGDEIYDPEASIPHVGGYISAELRSWKEFVLDFCSRFTGESPGTRTTAYCLRMILRPIFPSEVTEEAFEKLRGYLKVVGADATEEELVESVLDERKLPTDLLDSYLNILRGSFKLTEGYFFRLAVISLVQDFARTKSAAAIGRIRKIESQREKIERIVVEVGRGFEVPKAKYLLELMKRSEL